MVAKWAQTPAASARETAFGGEIELRFPYPSDLVADLKSEIPARYRRWDPDEKRWLVMGAYGPQAIDLLLAHFPRASVPDDAPRRITGTPARKARPPTPLTLLPAISTSSSDPDEPDPDALIAAVRCPDCDAEYTQMVRVTAATSRVIAKREQATPELIAVCPACTAFAVLAFTPAGVPVGVPS